MRKWTRREVLKGGLAAAGAYGLAPIVAPAFGDIGPRDDGDGAAPADTGLVASAER
jgi:hypothetical protein